MNELNAKEVYSQQINSFYVESQKQVAELQQRQVETESANLAL